ncbi:hypothetical protein HN748_00250 [Candidatus Peregrinibacteria bacterium]|jgi:hypothetical protein|nr:hypothetical protein [Candidatus Peregrinibacteria bacterium]MBT7484611.1 hypothetical protein [Candidatus Peregrinibacteria bacterium]MBT7702643.1 hypothetical protein [Candidatus Peregrinibacteria bacterium]
MIKQTIAFLLLLGLLLPSAAMAQSTLLPGADGQLEDEGMSETISFDELGELWDALDVEDYQWFESTYGITSACDYYFYEEYGDNFIFVFKDKSYFQDNVAQRNTVLACAIQSGRVSLWMLPYFVSYIANFFIAIGGTISLLFVILGGFWYMVGGITDDKEKGKKTIYYALIGMVISLLAWIIVNVVQVQVSG